MANKNILVQAGDGTAIPSGMVGEVKSATGAASTTLTLSNTSYSVASVSLEAGTWLVFGKAAFSTAGTSRSATFVSINTSVQQDPISQTYDERAINNFLVQPAGNRVLTLTGTTTVYLVAGAVFSGTAPSVEEIATNGRTRLQAIRIA
jgi:hypothetical protein